MKAWLITWQWKPVSTAQDEPIVAILNPRKSVRQVAEMVEILYGQAKYNVFELAEFFVKNKQRNPYRAMILKGEGIICGAKPWLYARKVSDVKISKDKDTDREIVSWLEPPNFRETKSGIQFDQPIRKFYRRTVDGPLSRELCYVMYLEKK